jgi:hypothetical protein
MKTVEEKAKAYEQAIEIIKGNLDALNEIIETGAEVVNIQSIKNCFCRAFPELKESGDEKIVNAIRKGLESKIEDLGNGVTRTACLAWLEKQGSPKSAPMQNGITINGVEYELIEDREDDECERCALQELCKSIEDEVICNPLYGPNVASYHRFEKRK